MVSVVLLVACTGLALSANVVNKAAHEGAEVLRQAKTEEKVRQCSCGEEKECVKEMKEQALACVDPCWGTVNKITKSPDELKQCFNDKVHLLHEFIDCFEEKLDGCVETMNGPMIKRTNINKLFDLGEERLEEKKEAFLKTAAAPMKRLIETAAEFGQCVKTCFEKKNGDGFCFDKKKCQPLVEEEKMTVSLKKCLKQVNWKEEAGNACDCAVKAGVKGVQESCPLLRTMKHNNNRT